MKSRPNGFKCSSFQFSKHKLPNFQGKEMSSRILFWVLFQPNLFLFWFLHISNPWIFKKKLEKILYINKTNIGRENKVVVVTVLLLQGISIIWGGLKFPIPYVYVYVYVYICVYIYVWWIYIYTIYTIYHTRLIFHLSHWIVVAKFLREGILTSFRHLPWVQHEQPTLMTLSYRISGVIFAP